MLRMCMVLRKLEEEAEAEVEADLAHDRLRGLLVLVMVLVVVWLLGPEFPAISEPKEFMRSR